MKIKYILPSVVFLVIVAILALSLSSPNTRNSGGQDIIGSKVDLTGLVSVGGGKGLDSIEPFILHVFSSWCDACKDDLTFLKGLGKAAKIYGLAWNDDPAAIRNTHMGRGVYEDVLVDPSSRVIFNLGIRSVPTTFIIEKDSTIVYSSKGPLKNGIDGLLAKFNGIRRIKPE